MNAKDDDGKGNFDVVRELLKLVEVDVNAKDKGDRTALFRAINKGHSDVVGELVQHEKVDVNVQGRLGYTALMWATVQGRSDIVALMLEWNNMDVDLRNKVGSTALDVARNCGMFDIAHCLEKHAKERRRRIEAVERSAQVYVRRPAEDFTYQEKTEQPRDRDGNTTV